MQVICRCFQSSTRFTQYSRQHEVHLLCTADQSGLHFFSFFFELGAEDVCVDDPPIEAIRGHVGLDISEICTFHILQHILL